MNLSGSDMNELVVISDGPVILSLPIADDCHCIMYVYTPPAMRGRGLMRTMFEARMKWADDNDKRLLLLLSPDDDTDRERLRAFYEGQGFEFGSDYPIDNHAVRVPASEQHDKEASL